MLINKKALERKLCQLNFIPTMVISVVIATFFCIKFIDFHQHYHTQRLLFIAALFSHIESENPAVFTTLADNVLTQDAYYTVALIDREGQILLSRGVTSNLPKPPPLANQLIVLKEHTKHFVYLPLSYRATNGSTSGWLLVSKNAHVDALWYYKAAIGFLALITIAFVLTLFFTRRFEKTTLRNLSLIEKNMDALKQERFSDMTRIPEGTFFSPLGNHLQEIADKLATSRADLQYTIDQSLIDLKETLETVEIQNIEIDLARKNALQANQATSEFLANTSHEVRTPINGIIGFSNLLRKTRITEQQSEYIDTIEESAKVLLLNINDIIDYSRLEIGKLNLDYKPVDVRSIIGESQKFVLAQVNTHATALECKIDNDIPTKLLGDAMRLKQVYCNLLRSAIELSQSPEITSAARIKAFNGNKISLEIRICARGNFEADLSLNEARQVLDAPSPDSEHLKNKHLMSLIIARGLVGRMQGKLGLDIDTEFASFWFTVELGQAKTTTAEQSSTPSTSSQPRESVLIVDDTQANRRLVSELLRGWGLSTTQAASGEEAIELSQKNYYSLILMDIQMPGLNGFETTEHIRKNEKIHGKTRTPIIALTAHAVEDEKSRLLISGMDDFSSKPIGEAELHELLSRWAPQSLSHSEVNKTRAPQKAGASHKTNNAAAPGIQSPKRSSHQTVRHDEKAHNDDLAVNIESCLSLANGKHDLAKDMLTMLLEGIASDLPKMKRYWQEENFAALHESIHRIHGGACYCGVPQLLKISAGLDKQLKDEQYSNAAENIDSMFTACEALLVWREEHNIDALFQAS